MQPDFHPASKDQPDRRQEQRHEVERPCRVLPANAPEVEFAATTGNISRSGMLLHFPRNGSNAGLPRQGDYARILVELPAAAGREPRLLECTGRILRATDSPEGAPALAVEVHGMKFLDKRESARAGKRAEGYSVQ